MNGPEALSVPDIYSRENGILTAIYLKRQSELVDLTDVSILKDGLIAYPVPKNLVAIPAFVEDKDKWKQVVLFDRNVRLFGVLSMQRIESQSGNVAIWFPRNIQSPTFEQARSFAIALTKFGLHDNRVTNELIMSVNATITMNAENFTPVGGA
jgi:hypothetical protein